MWRHLACDPESAAQLAKVIGKWLAQLAAFSRSGAGWWL